MVGQDAPRPQQEALTFRDQALEGMTAVHQGNVQLMLQLADRLGRRRLGREASGGGPRAS